MPDLTDDLERDLSHLRQLDRMAAELVERANLARSTYDEARERVVNANKFTALLDDFDRAHGDTPDPGRLERATAETETFAAAIAIQQTAPEALRRLNELRDELGRSVAPRIEQLSKAEVERLRRRGLI